MSEEVCPQCGGSGEVAGMGDRNVKCPVCRGTGKVKSRRKHSAQYRFYDGLCLVAAGLAVFIVIIEVGIEVATTNNSSFPITPVVVLSLTALLALASIVRGLHVWNWQEN